jgi:hypothetical protein
VWVGGGTPTVLGFRGSDGTMCGGSTGQRWRPQTATILDDPPSDAEIPVGVVPDVTIPDAKIPSTWGW